MDSENVQITEAEYVLLARAYFPSEITVTIGRSSDAHPITRSREEIIEYAEAQGDRPMPVEGAQLTTAYFTDCGMPREEIERFHARPTFRCAAEMLRPILLSTREEGITA